MKEQIFKMAGQVPLPSPAASVEESFKLLVSAWSDYKKTAEVEQTKRAEIAAYKDTTLSQISAQKQILEQYLAGVFKERAETISGFFERLDSGIERGDSALVGASIEAIVNITKQSPLAGAREIISAMYDPNVKTIEI